MSWDKSFEVKVLTVVVIVTVLVLGAVLVATTPANGAPINYNDAWYWETQTTHDAA